MEDGLRPAFSPDVPGKTPGRRVEPAGRAGDPLPGFDEVAFGMSVDPGGIAGDDALMAQLNERGELLRGYCDSICG